MRTISTFMICIIAVGCSLFQLPEKQPKDFAFIVKYGVEGKNELNTYQGTFTKDLVSEGVVKTKLKLTPKELTDIYRKFREISILSYPDNYRPDQQLFVHRIVTPHQTYYIKLRFQGQEKEIFWADGSLSEKSKAENLRDVINYIRGLIEAKEEYKKLPKAKSGYL